MSDADVRELLRRFRDGERPALNRLVSLASRGERLNEIRDELSRDDCSSRIIAVTGNSGVGKSTLVGRLVEHVRQQGESVAVLACDPESALTGGALLGDRVRMSAHAGDEGVWIRSLASASGQQAVADHVDVIARLLSAFGFDHILLETVGAGQGDVAVESLADIVALLVQPEIGDELQWEKAGVLEVADVVIVHKGDLPGADATEAQVRELLNLPGCAEKPVVRVSSKSKSGIDELWTLLQEYEVHLPDDRRTHRRLLRLVQERVADVLAVHQQALESIIGEWEAGDLTDEQAVCRVIADVLRDAGDRS